MIKYMILPVIRCLYKIMCCVANVQNLVFIIFNFDLVVGNISSYICVDSLEFNYFFMESHFWISEYII